MALGYTDQSGELFEASRRTIRKGRSLLRPWRSLDTRLRVPLIETDGQLHIAINPTGHIDRLTTARLTGKRTSPETNILRLMNFRDRQDAPVPSVGVPIYSDLVPTIDSDQTFRGYELTLRADGACLLRGLGVELEPVDIVGLQPDHVLRFAKACVSGAKTHLAC